MYRKILMPADGSPSSELAIEKGLELAKLTGAEVTFLHILENPLAAGYVAAANMAYSAELYEDLRNSANQLLEHVVAMAREKGVTAKGVLVEDVDPVQAIHEAEKDHDLVVMGTHGRRGFNRWMFGSVAEGALRRSTVPYLVVRSEVEA
ncbi:MAG: universal stress protein [Trueperaceae bacterium]|jgi:nucleotide-binding universal stress UspA family protein